MNMNSTPSSPLAYTEGGLRLPAAFVESLREFIAQDDIASFTEALGKEPSCSVRVNPCKGWCPPEGAVPVAWCREGFSLAERPVFTLDPAFHGGAYYVQEAGSMFVGYLARRALDLLGAEHPCVLDLCAAPGGKSTHLSSLLGKSGTLVANEVMRGRVTVLSDNIRKWGMANTIVTCSDPAAFGAMGGLFDIMVVDAPCSGEGMFRKEPQALAQWSSENVRMCAERGRRIIADAWDALAEGGILIYSTCTYNRHENEETVEWIADNFDTAAVSVVLPEDSGITVTEVCGGGTVHRCYRFMPHKTAGEGLFAVVLRKASGGVIASGPGRRQSPIASCSKSDTALLRSYLLDGERFDIFSFRDDLYACPSVSRNLLEMAATRLQVVYSPLHMGRTIRGKFKPAHPLALTPWLERDRFAISRLDMSQALDYLRRTGTDASSYADGISLVCHGDIPLGFANKVDRRVNNMYPKELRIMNL